MNATPHNVTWSYQGRRSSTSFGTEVAARTFAAALRKRGIKIVLVRPL